MPTSATAMKQPRTPLSVRARPSDVLHGWKEIARYIQRDVRTVERWEKQRGLPVRRVPGQGRAAVYARVAELEAWLESRPLEGGTAEEQPGNLVSFPQLVVPTEMAAEVLPQPGEPVVHRAEAAPSVTDAAIPTHAAQQPAKISQRRTLALWAAAAVLVAVSVVAGLRLFTRAPLPTPKVARSAVPEVDELYLHGMYALEQRTPASLEDALTSLTSATKRDPAYAPAYAGLATTWILLREYSSRPDAVCFGAARENAKHALELNPKLPQAHADLGFVDYFDQLDSVGADGEFHIAIALDPTLPLPHHWYGSVLTHQGRLQEALQQLDEAQHLDPTSSSILVTRALTLGLAGDRARASALLGPLLAATADGSDHASATAHRVVAYLSLLEPREMGRYLDESLRSAELRKDASAVDFFRSMSSAFQQRGADGAWQAALAWRGGKPGEPELQQAQALVALGRNDEALQVLQAIAAQDKRKLSGLNIDPVLRKLAGDPRFQQLQATLRVSAGAPL